MNARYSREEGTKSPVYTKGICQKKWFSFFPCLLTMVEQLTQQGLALNLIEYKWLLPLDKMHALILRIPALSEFSAGAEGWAFMQHAANLCKFPLSVLNCLFQVKNLLNPQMWKCCQMDSEGFPSEERLPSDLSRYRFELSVIFTAF